MLHRMATGFFQRTHPYVITSLFLSILMPSVFLVYTGLYGIWYHAIASILLTACFFALLISHHAHGSAMALKKASRASAARTKRPSTHIPVITMLDYEFLERAEAHPAAFPGNASGESPQKQPSFR